MAQGSEPFITGLTNVEPEGGRLLPLFPPFPQPQLMAAKRKKTDKSLIFICILKEFTCLS
jgi:hypothetical protein